MRVYIAASSREVERVRAAQALATEWGWTVTLDWLTPMLAALDAGKRDRGHSPVEQARFARDDLGAIESADLLWLLSPRELTKGAWVELGYALALGIPVLVSGCAAEAMPSIFVALCTVVDEDWLADEGSKSAGVWWHEHSRRPWPRGLCLTHHVGCACHEARRDETRDRLLAELRARQLEARSMWQSREDLRLELAGVLATIEETHRDR